MSDRITDTRPPIILIDDAVVTDYDLTPYEGWLYVVIVKHANRKTKEAFPGLARLAKIAKMSKSQVMRAIATLEAKKLIRVDRDELPAKNEKRQRTVNHYFVLPVNSSSQEVGVVSGRNYPSGSQEVGVVSGSDKNQESLEPSTPLPPNVAVSDSHKSSDAFGEFVETMDIPESPEVSETPPDDKPVAQPPITDNAASLLILNAFLTATKSADMSMLTTNARKIEALRLYEDGMRPQHIKTYVDHMKAAPGYWHGQNVTWKHLIGNIVSHFETKSSKIIHADGYIPVEERTSVLDGVVLS